MTARPRVLVVDDAVFMRRMLREILGEAGFSVVAEAGDGREAIEAYAEVRPDVVTLDIVMPETSGIEALRAILASDPKARIVMISAIGQESMIVEALRLGALDYLVKPFRRDDVVEVVGKAAGRTV